MVRSPLQILVFPYRRTTAGWQIAIFRRSAESGGYWQGIAGGGEGGETPLEAARRETFEEAGVPGDSEFFRLDAATTVSVDHFGGGKLWGPEIYVVPVHVFAVRFDGELRLSQEHTAFRWCSCAEAKKLVKWDIDRTALFELDRRLQQGNI